MSGGYVTRDELRGDIHDARADAGVALEKARADWQEDLALQLRAFKNEMRLLIAVAILVLKFQVPSEITAVALGGVFVKSVIGFFRLH